MTTRLNAAAQAIGDLPLAASAIDDRYATFLRTGELPDQRRLAWAVVERALRARKCGTVSRQISGNSLAGPPREQVFREATHSCEPASKAARLVIQLLVAADFDPSDPDFVPADMDQPEFGPVALHLLGWPDRWVDARYEQQMQRVLRQHAALRQAGERSNWWFQEAARALAGFLKEGRVPQDEDLRRFTLTVGEMFAIHAHHFGHGDPDLLAAYEVVAMSAGPQLEAARRQLGELQARHRSAW